MALSDLWFVLIAVLFIGFMILEGFDFGVGMGTKFLAKTEREKQLLIHTIGPVWDANEVWLITAGGAMFAAFPHWYATVFSGYYMPFVLLLIVLIARGVAFEFREKVDSPKWIAVWDWSIFAGSIVPPFLLGVLFSSMLKGMPVDGDMNLHAGFADFVNIYTVAGGVAFVLLSYLHGLLFLTLKTEGPMRKRAKEAALRIYWAAGIVLAVFIGLTAVYTDAFASRQAILIPLFAVVLILYALLHRLIKKGREGFSFTVTAVTLAAVTASFFIGLFPNVLVSTIDSAFNMTIKASASGEYSLKLMTFVALTMVPIVIGYTIWSYYVFRKRLTEDSEHLEY
ncbi:cytochrome d ubiquinol oxidase subunit II [Sporosarcina trichiuri]|uniref:cytochrome d ubiquinol oxidase subunit II n=1 Tax=Sporosarcina trichiuri TaxID=3056445 RepID=UPI0025B38FDF|nr:cytochrome d ubiquinol oxidase subunit II [Sporosarcina sp. 0.2-SM1T-5]WJY28009.1 cytochrome d ubiquinol oxidase subunit II [Sporosarcina sp. 0.2-SM1T-5]